VCQASLSSAGSTGSASTGYTAPRSPPVVQMPDITVADIIEHTRLQIQEAEFERATGYHLLAGQDFRYMIFLNDTMFRKESLICCFSEAVFYAGTVISAVGLEVLLTVRSLLTLLAAGAPPDDVVYVPTFELAAADLRTALCKLFCAATRLLPEFFTCEQLHDDDPDNFLCDSGSSCATGLLCAFVDVAMNVVEIGVQLLQLIRSVIKGSAAPPSNLLSGEACQSGDEGLGCVVEILVVFIVEIGHSLTAAARAGAALVDCTLCALTTLIDPMATCDAVIFAFVRFLARHVVWVSALNSLFSGEPAQHPH